MRQRPWPILILAFFHLLAPLFNLLFCSWIFKLTPAHYFELLIKNQPTWVVAEFFLLLPIGGIAIYLVKKWSYPVFFGIFLINLFQNYQAIRTSPGQFGWSVVILAYVLNLAIVSYFLIPAVRTAYFNPRLRWWETKPRFLLNVLGEFKVGEKTHPCTVLNISEGGAFLCSDVAMKPGTEIQIIFRLLTREIHLRGATVYRKLGDTAGYGVQFLHTPETLDQMTRVIRAFKLMGLARRPEVGRPWDEFKLWAKTLITTGKGWKPELPELGSKGSRN